MDIQSNLNKRAAFAYEVGVLRFIPRDFQQDGITTAQNVAEHTYRVTMLAWLIASMEGEDTGEVLKMALAHDLPEVRTMDLGVVQSQYTVAHEAEAATDQMKDTLPEALTAWQNYEKRASKAAQIVKDADRLDIVLECEEFKMRGFQAPDIWDAELKKYEELLFTESAKRLLREIHTTHPLAWKEQCHQNKISKMGKFQSHKRQA